MSTVFKRRIEGGDGAHIIITVGDGDSTVDLSWEGSSDSLPMTPEQIDQEIDDCMWGCIVYGWNYDADAPGGDFIVFTDFDTAVIVLTDGTTSGHVNVDGDICEALKDAAALIRANGWDE